jgi:hypothetical protein
MRVFLAMKQPINWQNLDPNVCSKDLNQLAASQYELPRMLSGTGQGEAIKNTGNPS